MDTFVDYKFETRNVPASCRSVHAHAFANGDSSGGCTCRAVSGRKHGGQNKCDGGSAKQKVNGITHVL